MRTPVSIIQRALPWPMMRGKRWVPPSMKGTPQRRLRAPNSALAEAMRKSHQHASSMPPAKQ